MYIALIIVSVLLALSLFLNYELWTLSKELKEEVEFCYGEHTTDC